MELYKTFGFALTPFMILFLIGFMYAEFSKTSGFLITEFSTTQIVALFSVVVFCMLFMGIALEWWVNLFYGKHAKEIRSLLDELKDE
jgi:membrane-bound ClpP family serine protease